MNAFELTRALIDIDSVTPNEEQVGVFLRSTWAGWRRAPAATSSASKWNRTATTYWRIGRAGRDVLHAHRYRTSIFRITRRRRVYLGRGACDTKGIIASMIFALEALLAAGERRIALLFVVGEERNSAGAHYASKDPRGGKYLINGEPTEGKLVLGSKGALRFEIVAQGRMAHSAYPHLGESAIEKLLDALERVRKIALPHDAVLGHCTMNIGTIQGGRAPNVIPDHAWRKSSSDW